MPKVTLTRNTGFADTTELPEGSTILDLFFQVKGQDAAPGHYKISVNGKTVGRNYVMQDGDSVTISQ